MKNIIIILVCVFCSWSNADSIREITYVGFHITDWMQTKQGISDGMKELNPILGEHPSMSKIDTIVGLSLIGHILISGLLPKPYRETFQYITIGIESGAVLHNYNAGVRIEF